ncbi:MAG: hypothetical protein P4M11_13210 [Candidatus Pacebacteria bacterium]|nr:hypothetical protein [Candidatus Paceibacterota bacterium]
MRIESDFTNAKEQIKSLHESLLANKVVTIRIDQEICTSITKCISAIEHGLDNAEDLMQHARTKKELAKFIDAKEYPDEMEDIMGEVGSEGEVEGEVERPTNNLHEERQMNLNSLKFINSRDPVVVIVNNIGCMRRAVLNELIKSLLYTRSKHTGW